MAGYVDSTLMSGEKVQYRGKVSLWSLFHLFFLGFVLIPVFIGPLFWIIAAVRYLTTELAITDRRVISKFGLIRRDTVELNISRVESMQVDQSILGRLFGFGTIVISGAGNPQAPIPGISKPLMFRRAFFAAQERTVSVNDRAA
ncbi:MAG TPA: hypothetical protein DCZ12_12105 [Gammaproteobacteria bacterium]|nr:hypothetical protein [Gammaproteobacteria bacterium]